jgi:hypothetical protein
VAELAAFLWYVLPVAVVVSLLHGRERVWSELGLCGNVWSAVGYAFVLSLPMLVGYA